MDFGLALEISKGVTGKANIIINISNYLENYFKYKNYGGGLEILAIGIICVRPEVDYFFKIRNKYSKSEKLLEYDVKLDYQKFVASSESEIKHMLSESIIDSLSIIREMKIPDFNLEQFRDDLEKCFKEILRTNP